MLEDVLKPEERFAEYDDLEKCIRLIAGYLMAEPDFKPEGVSLDDKERNHCITIYRDKQGIYGKLVTEEGETGLSDLNEIIRAAQYHFLCDCDGYETLKNAVLRSGRERTFMVGDRPLTMTPMDDDTVDISYVTEDENDFF